MGQMKISIYFIKNCGNYQIQCGIYEAFELLDLFQPLIIERIRCGSSKAIVLTC
jgi:hypothetical protein